MKELIRFKYVVNHNKSWRAVKVTGNVKVLVRNMSLVTLPNIWECKLSAVYFEFRFLEITLTFECSKSFERIARWCKT